MSLPNAAAGLPPTMPPVPPVLFASALAHDDEATGGGFIRRLPSHEQLGTWYGTRKRYQGIILTFFTSIPAAEASLKSLTSLGGGKRMRNVVATWDLEAPWPQKPAPARTVRDTVFGCLRSGAAGAPSATRPRPATLATFAGGWGGHTRGMSITSTGRGSENVNDGCCHRVYDLTFQILSVNGTLTRATAVFRVTSFRRHESDVRLLRVGDVGKLLLRNGIVTNALTGVYYCSDPAWGATGACGA